MISNNFDFYFFQYYLPLKLITKQVFTQWMEVIHKIIDRPVPKVSSDMKNVNIII